MKAIISLLLLSLCTITAEGQITDLKTHNIVKDSIVAKFNRQDFKGIYEMADTGFKIAVSENDMVAFLKAYYSLGKVTGSGLLKQNGGNFEFRLQCINKSLQLTLGAVNAKSFKNFGLDIYRLPPVRTRVNFKHDNPLKTELDSVVQKAVANYISNENVGGLSVGVLKDGISYTYNFGETKKGSNHLINNNTIYEIGSMTKPFTGILLANAVLDGKLKLEDDIRKYLNGNFPNLQYNDTPIQIVHLANLTSRIPSDPTTSTITISPMSGAFKGEFDNKMFAEILTSITLDTLPGTRREYSNFAVCVLGKILEKAYGMTYEQILTKYIITPYKMKQTKINLTKNDLKKYAQGYGMDGTPVPYWINNAVDAVGGIRSTVSDMLVFMKEQFNPNNKAAHLSHQLTFGTENGGKGLLWGIDRTKANYLRLSHDGSSDGFASVIWIFPEIKSGIVILTNNGDYSDESFSAEIYLTIYKYLSKRQ
jgi:CubicO group peptidase (beta-lactamase class C family)